MESHVPDWEPKRRVWASGGPIPLVSGNSHSRVECSHLKGGPRVRALFACFHVELAI